nr:unnamed protein product [Digitaria exilis]
MTRSGWERSAGGECVESVGLGEMGTERLRRRDCENGGRTRARLGGGGRQEAEACGRSGRRRSAAFDGGSGRRLGSRVWLCVVCLRMGGGADCSVGEKTRWHDGK